MGLEVARFFRGPSASRRGRLFPLEHSPRYEASNGRLRSSTPPFSALSAVSGAAGEGMAPAVLRGLSSYDMIGGSGSARIGRGDCLPFSGRVRYRAGAGLSWKVLRLGGLQTGGALFRVEAKPPSVALWLTVMVGHERRAGLAEVSCCERVRCELTPGRQLSGLRSGEARHRFRYRSHAVKKGSWRPFRGVSSCASALPWR